MSIQAVGWALEQDLPARPKLVLVAIANHASHVDGYCWLKAETIAREAACSPRSVYNFLGALVRNGFIRKAPRKGDDGKQRANDYWIMFGREEKPWDNSASLDEPETEDEPSESEGSDAGTTTSCGPTAQDAVGENGEPTARDDSRQAVDMSSPAVGPTAPACSRYESLEPSKSKPKRDARAGAFVPRSYRPPPEPAPQPLGEVIGKNADQIFVFKPSKAYDAWAVRMSIQNRLGLDPSGRPRWQLETTKIVDGQSRRGWYFPSLFPPPVKRDTGGSDPPEQAA